MPRARRQTGQLLIQGRKGSEFWSARFYVYVKTPEGEKAVRKTRRLGWQATLTRVQALNRMTEVMQSEQAKEEKLAVFCPRSADRSTIAGHAKGKIGELIVSADLLARGFEVFEHVDEWASCDLIALRGKQMIRVEVKYAGGIRHYERTGRFDLLAVVSLKLDVQYFDSEGRSVINWALTEGEVA